MPTSSAARRRSIQRRTRRYDRSTTRRESCAARRACALGDLEPGMVLAASVRTKSGHILVTSGQEVSPSMIARLANFHATDDPVAEPLFVASA